MMPVMVIFPPRIVVQEKYPCRAAINACVNRRMASLCHLGHPQMGERQLEFADVDHISAQLAGARVPEFLGLLSVAVHGFAAVERRR